MQNPYKNKKVLIFGLGINDGGLGMAEYFAKAGAKLTITDGKNEAELKESIETLRKHKNITYHLGGHIEQDFIDNDIIIRNPAIKSNNPYLEIARKHNKEIIMEMTFFHQNFLGTTIGITGTKGKSTTTSLIYDILKKQLGKKVLLGGNIGKSAVRQLPKLTKEHIAVLELSSFQTLDMGEHGISPNIALITNVTEDHLNWHKDLAEYEKAKKYVFLNQQPKDHIILNIDDPKSKSFLKEIKSTLITVSISNKDATFCYDNDIVLKNGEEILRVRNKNLRGEHNKYNILGAVAVAGISGIDINVVEQVIAKFKGVPNRQEFVRKIDGISFINDTTATNIEAMKACLRTFGTEYKGKIVLIAGGMDKNLDYSKITNDLEVLKELVLLEGTGSEKLFEIAKRILPNHIHKYFGNFEEAIMKAKNLAVSGDIVILCPGATSFNMFKNEFDRGSQFTKIVKELDANK